jgi:hypothetical protein
MIGDQREATNTAAEHKTNPPTTDRIYRIACTFRALTFKGVENGNILGIDPDGF